MLSILIPLYNIDGRPLVQELLEQCCHLQLPVEIRIYDDASDPEFQTINSGLSNIPGLVYRLLPQNMGRAKIRNLLAKEALYEYLLFLDADASISQSDFLQQYLDKACPGKVWYGGRSYNSTQPADRKLLLHWRVGQERESIPAAQRSQKPYLSFMSNNFLIPRDLFLQIGFDEGIIDYGHEDTVFGLRLKELQVPLLHLNNPLEHTGLESAAIFLEKTDSAACNLLKLKRIYPQLDTPLLYWYKRLRNLPFLSVVLAFAKKWLKTFLCRFPGSPLRLFDLYKIACLFSCEKQRNR